MTKVALITDTHWGCRNDSKQLRDNQAKFFDEIFFPYVDKYQINHVIHLGDVFDRRKYVNFTTANETRKHMFQPMFDRGMEIHVLLGNHDCTYKNTNSVNCMRELYGSDDGKYLGGMKVYENPELVNIAGKDMLMLPWICAANEGQSYEIIKRNQASLVFGHLELAGFPMYKNSISDHGMDHGIFSNYDMVYSGHFHHKSLTRNIYYLGSTGQYDWNDYGDSRGFHILDTEKDEPAQFISNDFWMFNRYTYDDVEKTPEQILNFDYTRYAGTFVKMVVKNKQDPFLLEKVIDKFEKSDTVSLQVVEEMSMYGLDDVITTDDVDETEDTLAILHKTVQAASDIENKAEVEKFLNEIYYEAMTRGG